MTENKRGCSTPINTQPLIVQHFQQSQSGQKYEPNNTCNYSTMTMTISEEKKNRYFSDTRSWLQLRSVDSSPGMTPHPCHVTYCPFCYKAVGLDRAEDKYDGWNKEGLLFCSYTSITICCGSQNFSIWAITNGIYWICHFHPVEFICVCTLMSTLFYTHFNARMTPGSI